MLQSIAQFLINPLLYVWVGLLLPLFIKSSRRRYFVILNLLFYVSAIPLTGWFFHKAWTIDDTYKPGLTYDFAVVLLGISEYSWYIENNELADDLPCYYRFGNNADRILIGITLVKKGRVNKLLLGKFTPRSFDETELLKDFALQNGLTKDQITVYGRVERTVDEAKGVKAFTANTPIRHLLLITSEMHMRRAFALFRHQDLSPDTYSVPSPTIEVSWESFIPSSGGVKMTAESLYELVGYLGYFLKGDI